MAIGLTHQQFIEKLEKINPNIEVLETYINMKTSILFKCKIDGNIWKNRPTNILEGAGCKKCYSKKRTKTHENFLKELKENNENIIILDEYKGIYEKIKIKCSICNNMWEETPANLLYFDAKCNKYNRFNFYYDFNFISIL